MAISFIELERLAPYGEALLVPQGDTLVFDGVISSEGTEISYSTSTGVITFNAAGFYFIDWFVSPNFGLTKDGSNWAIRTAIGQLEFIGSSHSKVSATTGFAIFNAPAGETARLVNVASGDVYLSKATIVKAGLIAYRVAALTGS